MEIKHIHPTYSSLQAQTECLCDTYQLCIEALAHIRTETVQSVETTHDKV